MSTATKTRVAPTRIKAPTESPVEDITGGYGADIDCECMLCHLPMGKKHEPVEWRVVVHFPGPYPMPGDEAMLMCDECKVRWTEHTDEFPGVMSIARVHPI